MFIVTHSERVKIDNGEKVSTLRAIKESGKGYFQVGSLQKVCEGRDFRNGIFNRVLILRRSFVSIPDLTKFDFKCLGYNSKAEYLAQPYNQGNPSPDRVRYDFIALPDLLENMCNSDITPESFEYYWNLVRNAKELAKNVRPELVFEGCDVDDLEEQFYIIIGNIEEAKI